MEAITLSHPSHCKGKKPVAISPCRKAASTIFFPHILEGACVASNLLGHVENLQYSDHDVIETDKFLEFENKFYLDIVGIGHFGEPINQPK
jgi:hypothetical protein